MLLTILSGYLAFATVLLFGARFVMRKSVTAFDLFTVVGGHFTHGVAMVYMALVMLGADPIFGWGWISYFFAFFALVFVLRFFLVVRVEAFSKESVFGFEHTSRWWWEVLHIANHVAMAYMFLDMSLWSEVLTIWAIASSAALLILGASNWIEHAGGPALANKPYALFGGLGHVTMALSMIIMFGVMQWWGGDMAHGDAHHDQSAHGHAAVSSTSLHDDKTETAAGLMETFHTAELPLTAGSIAICGEGAVVIEGSQEGVRHAGEHATHSHTP